MVSKETIVAILLGVLILVSAVQTYQLVGLASRAKDGTITVKPSGALAERTSASSYSASATATTITSGGGCG